MPPKAHPFLVYAGLLVSAVVIHLLLGWAWTLLVGLAAGLLFGRHGWLHGALVVGADWLALIVYNYLVDARAVRVMTDTMGGILGNLPSFAIVAITVFIGTLLGLIGGAAGTQLRLLVVDGRQKVRT